MTQEQRERLKRTVRELKDTTLTLEDLELPIDDSLSLIEQIKQAEKITETINQVVNELHVKYSDLSNMISFEISPIFSEELDSLKQVYLEQETDTAREAAELIDQYLQNPDPRLLRAALGWVKSQVPPTEEVYETIKYETAIIEDSEMNEGEEVVEIEGQDGELKIVYEVVGDGRTEVSREVVKEPVRKVVRVGTKPI